MGGLERTLNFVGSCAERQLPGCARLLAAQAAGLVCSEDPLEFKAHKRGRSRQVFDSIPEGLSFGNVPKHFVGGCAGVDAGSPPRCIEAHRVAMPEKACIVPLSKWLRPSLLDRQSRVLFWSQSRAVAGMSPSNGTGPFAQSLAF